MLVAIWQRGDCGKRCWFFVGGVKAVEVRSSSHARVSTGSGPSGTERSRCRYQCEILGIRDTKWIFTSHASEPKAPAVSFVDVNMYECDILSHEIYAYGWFPSCLPDISYMVPVPRFLRLQDASSIRSAPRFLCNDSSPIPRP